MSKPERAISAFSSFSADGTRSTLTPPSDKKPSISLAFTPIDTGPRVLAQLADRIQSSAICLAQIDDGQIAFPRPPAPS